jgi:hypothetical protein
MSGGVSLHVGHDQSKASNKEGQQADRLRFGLSVNEIDYEDENRRLPYNVIHMYIWRNREKRGTLARYRRGWRIP